MSLSKEAIAPTQSSKNYQRLASRDFDQFVKDVNTSINVESLAKDLFGQQNFNSRMSNSERLHFGRKGSLVVNKSGEYAGRFQDFESGEHGNLIQLVQREKDLNFKSALSYVSSYVNSPSVVQRIEGFNQGKLNKELIDWDAVLKDELSGKEAEKDFLQEIGKIDQDIQKFNKKISDVEVENEAPLEAWKKSVQEAARTEDETGTPQGILHSTPPGQDFIDIYRQDVSDLEIERELLVEKAKLLEGKELETKEKESQVEKERAQKIGYAKEIIAKTVSLKDTPAESYLKNERGIQGELPDSLRYLPAGSKFHYNGKDSYVRDGALAAIATDSKGNAKAVQVTYLTKEGKRAETPDGDKFPKISYGSLKGTCVQLQVGEKGAPIVIAEGVETALSLKEAGVKGDIACSLGTSNMKNLNFQNRDVIIAGDWDGSFEKPSWEATEKAKAALENKGNKVTLILPVKNPELTNEKVDFNDILREDGISSIVDRLPEKLTVKSTQPTSYRDNHHEKKHEKIKNIYANQGSTDYAKHDQSTSPSQEKKGSVEKMDQKAIPSPIAAKISLSSPSTSIKNNPFKTNPFKTNPFDMKSCANEGRSR